MEIMQVTGSLVCTQRVAGLGHMQLRVLRTPKGKLSVAVDPVGASVGNWVFTASGSAARFACGNPDTYTDLTIAGIIDFWEPDG
jgi:ethanolamine utilization protein EutN